MGKKTKRLTPLAEEGSCNIGDPCHARPKPKMAAQPDPCLSSEEEILDAPDAIPGTEGLNTPLPEEDLTTP
ncbi:Hypothetical predicted protein, partial [Pelobates cultripes]